VALDEITNERDLIKVVHAAHVLAQGKCRNDEAGCTRESKSGLEKRINHALVGRSVRNSVEIEGYANQALDYTGFATTDTHKQSLIVAEALALKGLPTLHNGLSDDDYYRHVGEILDEAAPLLQAFLKKTLLQKVSALDEDAKNKATERLVQLKTLYEGKEDHSGIGVHVTILERELNKLLGLELDTKGTLGGIFTRELNGNLAFRSFKEGGLSKDRGALYYEVGAVQKLAELLLEAIRIQRESRCTSSPCTATS